MKVYNTWRQTVPDFYNTLKTVPPCVKNTVVNQQLVSITADVGLTFIIIFGSVDVSLLNQK